MDWPLQPLLVTKVIFSIVLMAVTPSGFAHAARYLVPITLAGVPGTTPQKTSPVTSGTTQGAGSSSPSGGTNENEGRDASVGRTQAPAPVVAPRRKITYFTLGVGPYVPNHLDANAVMYGVDTGVLWDIQPNVSLKFIGQAVFSPESDGARFYNLGIGANYYFPGAIDSAPFLTTDVGYGLAETGDDAEGEGFSLGVGGGFQFYRNTQTTLDLLLRYSVIFDNINGAGNPSIIGARLAVNF